MNNKVNRIIFFLFIALTVNYGCGNKTKNVETGKTDTSWIEEITITDIQKGYKESKFTVSEVVSACLDRINQIDKNGPNLNSVISVNPDALLIAAELDSNTDTDKFSKPLYGIPVIIKDNIDTRDNMPTTAGAVILKNSYIGYDSQVAAKLRKAGAIIIGKSNLSEWANFRSATSSSGWSGIGGQTKNPYVLDRNPCGSSSGSGVAVATSLCVVAIGTETNGSIVCPSNNNGVVGIKPTVGLISRSGIIPISFTQDTPGPMARTVEDAVKCLGVLTGIDSTDSKTLASSGRSLTDYTPFLKTEGLKGKRIGIVKNAGGFSEKTDQLFNQAVEVMKKNGAELIEIQVPATVNVDDYSYKVMLYEFKDGLNKYLKGTGNEVKVKTLKDLIEFNKSDSVELKYFDQRILIEADSKGDLNSLEYKEALKKMLSATRENGIDKIMNENKLDALIAPTGSPAWKTDMILGDHYVGGNSSLAAISGYPAISVPMGMVNNLPVGITFFGRAWSEPVLIEISYGFEQHTHHRSSPAYIVSD